MDRARLAWHRRFTEHGIEYRGEGGSVSHSTDDAFHFDQAVVSSPPDQKSGCHRHSECPRGSEVLTHLSRSRSLDTRGESSEIETGRAGRRHETCLIEPLVHEESIMNLPEFSLLSGTFGSFG